MQGHADAIAAIEAAEPARLEAALRLEQELIHAEDEDGRTLLHRAIIQLELGDYSRPVTLVPDPSGDRLRCVELLLDAGSDVQHTYGERWTALHGAAYIGHAECARLLVARGASTEREVYAPGGTPLVQALFWGHVACADHLSGIAGAPANLREAAGLGDVAAVQGFVAPSGELLPGAGDRRAWYRPHTDFPEWTPSDDPQEVLDESLGYAARSGRLDALAALVERGANVNSAPYRAGPLQWAAWCDQPAAAEWLLARGADVNRRTGLGNMDGVTPLHAAAWAQRADVVRVLLAHDAALDLKDATHDSTPLGWATFRQAPDIVALLRAAGATD